MREIKGGALSARPVLQQHGGGGLGLFGGLEVAFVGRDDAALHEAVPGVGEALHAGLAVARARPPHLIILDVPLPDGSGFDVCRQFRRLKRYPPIVMLTVRSSIWDAAAGAQAR